MIMIGCGFHPAFQQLPVLEMESGECEQRKLMHATGEAERSQALSRPRKLALVVLQTIDWTVLKRSPAALSDIAAAVDRAVPGSFEALP